MGLVELGILLFIILTVGHYIVLWSIYWERLLDLVKTKQKTHLLFTNYIIDFPTLSLTIPDCNVQYKVNPPTV